jgi:lactam utilization protein B
MVTASSSNVRLISKIEINVDCGEAFGQWEGGPDEELMPLIDAANVACGGHAGDPVTMRKTVLLAKKHGIKVGARELSTKTRTESRSWLPRQGGVWT